jgi:hypothetical protein
LTVSPPKGLSGDELKRWEDEHAERDYQANLESQRSRLEPAFRNPKAVKVLELLSIENPSAEIIYKIYELMPKNIPTIVTLFIRSLEFQKINSIALEMLSTIPRLLAIGHGIRMKNLREPIIRCQKVRRNNSYDRLLPNG